MLIICVQVVSSEIYKSDTTPCQLFNYKKIQCPKHTNQKNENEQKHTVFSSEVGQKQAETLFCDAEERAVRLSLRSLNSPKLHASPKQEDI